MLNNLKFFRRQAYKILRRRKIFQSYDADDAYVPVLKDGVHIATLEKHKQIFPIYEDKDYGLHKQKKESLIKRLVTLFEI